MQIISKGRIISSRIVLFPFCFVMFSQTKSLSFQHFHFHMFFHFYQVFEFEIFCSFEIGRGICSSGEIGKCSSDFGKKAFADETGSSCPVDIYVLNVNNRNTRKKCEICSKLTIKILEQRSGIFIVEFEHIPSSF